MYCSTPIQAGQKYLLLVTFQCHEHIYYVFQIQFLLLKLFTHLAHCEIGGGAKSPSQGRTSSVTFGGTRPEKLFLRFFCRQHFPPNENIKWYQFIIKQFNRQIVILHKNNYLFYSAIKTLLFSDLSNISLKYYSPVYWV